MVRWLQRVCGGVAAVLSGGLAMVYGSALSSPVEAVTDRAAARGFCEHSQYVTSYRCQRCFAVGHRSALWLAHGLRFGTGVPVYGLSMSDPGDPRAARARDHWAHSDEVGLRYHGRLINGHGPERDWRLSERPPDSLQRSHVLGEIRLRPQELLFIVMHEHAHLRCRDTLRLFAIQQFRIWTSALGAYFLLAPRSTIFRRVRLLACNHLGSTACAESFS
ncbi:uncharacterized protein MONBRDRAFT_8078 [Monosiga brevicollis MX1]|uniref:Uncharacterized protein n=1 Tax=Monosiga brevicollis TaxID=81824 RepID=A9UYZ6_MONBE|nr:uncharacterized protein MONBRDRAFT_8078 [Monosiga brevicollis MX1]EDQ89696.1 predicted protein [Monosiga brevicollis MX1]|eukprot:XP_001745725.1 hypothetical protein [Monosiga brevicollis MX1]